MTSPLLIVLTCREKNHYVLTTLPLIQDNSLFQFNKNRNVEVTYKLLRYRISSFISPSPLLHWDWVYLCPTSLIGRILPCSHFSLFRHELWSFGDIYHHLVWWIGLFGYLGSENISSALPSKNIFFTSPGLIQTKGIQVTAAPAWCVEISGWSSGPL